MSNRKRRFYFWFLIPFTVLALLVCLVTILPLDREFYRKTAEESLRRAIGYPVRVGQTRFAFWRGPRLIIEDLKIRDPRDSKDIFSCKRLVLRMGILPTLLKREVKWQGIVLEEPWLKVERGKEGGLVLFDEAQGGDFSLSRIEMLRMIPSMFGGSISIRRGRINWYDQHVGGGVFAETLSGIELDVKCGSFNKPLWFRFKASLGERQRTGIVSVEGNISGIDRGFDRSRANVDAEVDFKGVDLKSFWVYLRNLVPARSISGKVDIHGNYKGWIGGPFEAALSIRVKEPVIDYPNVFSSVHKAEWFNIDIQTEYKRGEVSVSSMRLVLPRLRVDARGKIYGIGTEDMGLEAEASSNQFDIEYGKTLIPFGIIASDVSRSLMRTEGRGKVRILSVRLAGKMKEIEHCDRATNSHVLLVRMQLSDLELKLPWHPHQISQAKGELVFRNGDLELKGIEGRILRSRIERVDGYIRGLLWNPTLDANCQGVLDLRDIPILFGSDIFPGSLRDLSGWARYEVGLKGELRSPLRLQHKGIYSVSDVRFIYRDIPFPMFLDGGRIRLGDESVEWSGLRVRVGKDSLITDGSYGWGFFGKDFDVDIKGVVDLKALQQLLEFQTLLPNMRHYARMMEGISGSAYVRFKGNDLADERASFECEFQSTGDIRFAPDKVTPALVLKEGAIRFSNGSFSFSNMKVMSRNSTVLINGSAGKRRADLVASGGIDLEELDRYSRSPLLQPLLKKWIEGFEGLCGRVEFRLWWSNKGNGLLDSLSGGEIRLRDISFRHSKISVPVSGLRGELSILPGQIRTRRLELGLGKSRLFISGSVSEPKKVGERWGYRRQLTMKIFSPGLDLDPFLPTKTDSEAASEGSWFKTLGEWLTSWSVDGMIEIREARLRGFHFEDLSLRLESAGDTVNLKALRFRAAGGDFTADGWVKPDPRGIWFAIRPRLSNMDARVLIALLFDKKRTGSLSFSGRLHLYKAELTGMGEDFQKLVESLQGGFSLLVEDGVIERFSLLSKIFSILNISQLFSGKLPDLSKKGLPYNRIAATFKVANGVASTEDLLLDSDSMRITAIGKLDLGSRLIDATVGIHPLVTVDMILSNIPIAGYILTGKNRAFISYVYEVSGNLDDPRIEAVPLKSAGKGIVGIIERLLETPLRPFKKNE